MDPLTLYIKMCATSHKTLKNDNIHVLKLSNRACFIKVETRACVIKVETSHALH